MADLEPQIHEFCAAVSTRSSASGHFDFVRDLGTQMPMRVISMLLGIPDSDQEAYQDIANDNLLAVPADTKEMSDGHARRSCWQPESARWRTISSPTWTTRPSVAN